MQIQVKSKGTLEFPDHITAKDVADKLHLTSPAQALAALINGTLCDTSTPLNDGDSVDFVSFESPEGQDIYWHTSAHVLAQAVLRLWPNALPTIGPSIEKGFYYDFANLTISDTDFERIEKEVQKIIESNYRPEKIEYATKADAKAAFNQNIYKCELIDGFEKGAITAYKQGEYIDLCRGPHLFNVGKIKAFKVLKTSGAYWRGDSSREMLTRIYGISFPDRDQLQEYIKMLEEAKKRDHKILGPALDLFSLKEEAPGMPFFHPHGMIMWHHLLAFMRQLLQEAGYVEIQTPLMMSRELWERSGHWFYYRDNMYVTQIEEREFAIKPMNCPGGMLYYRTASHSYRELPMRVAEFGHVHRFEASGALNGLFRVRGFHQDDAHLFILPEQIRSEIIHIINLTDKVYSTFGLPYKLELSTRPEKSMGTDADWELATNSLKNALDDRGQPYRINPGDGAFYGPKIDFHIRDTLGRFWQCGTVQLDMLLPEKFQLEYIDRDGTHKRPIMLHRTIFGSIERFLGIIIEHFAGKFPLWISPYPIRILSVADRHADYAHSVAKRFRHAGFDVDVDDSNESVGKKVRNAQLLKANYILTVGDREVEHEKISLRTRDNVVHGEVDISLFLGKVERERDTRSLVSPFSSEATQ